MDFTPATSCVLIVDLQSRLMPTIAESHSVVANAVRLAKAARLLDIPVLATEQNSHGLGHTVDAVAELVQGTMPKMHFDATRAPAWPSFLPASRGDVVVTGSETHVCVLQTVRGLLAGGRRVRIVADAVGSRTKQNRDAGLHCAEKAGAEIVTTEMTIFEWLERCEHPRFREALALIK